MTFRTLPVAMPDISKISSAFADRTRAAVCGALMDGAAWTPTELAGFCSVSKSTLTPHRATAHSPHTTAIPSEVVGEVRQGRHRYFRLAGPEVASVIESLAAIAGANFPSPKNYNAHRANTEFAAGRTCYNHLAGELGVRLLQELSAHGYISAHLQVTEDGDELLRSWGIPHPERLEGKPCLDTTHRVFHLAGGLGSTICARLLALSWIERTHSNRCVRLVPEGRAALGAAGLSLP